MKKTYICNRAYTCQTSGTSLTPPMYSGMGLDSTFINKLCGHCYPHEKCWPDRNWECDRIRLSSWHCILPWGEKTGNDLLPGRVCEEYDEA